MSEGIQASYAPGSWVAIAGLETWLLIEAEPTSELVARCWEVFNRNGELNDALTALASGGLGGLGSFALVGRSEYATRVIVRGAACADVRAQGESPMNLSSKDALTWTEYLVPGSAEIRVWGGDASGFGDLPLTGGVTLASAITLTTGSAPRWDAQRVAPSPPDASVAAPTPPAAAPPPAPAPPVEVAPPAADAGAPDTPSFDHLFGATIQPVVEEPKFTPPVIVRAPAENAPQIVVEKTPSAATLDPANADYPIGSPGLIDSVPWAVASGGPASPAAAPPAPVVAEPPPAAAPAPPVGAEPPAGAAPARSPEQEFVAPPLVVEEPPPAPSEPPAAVASDRDLAAATVSRSALLSAAMGSAPNVLSARCPAGHLCPAYATRCRVCQEQMPHQEPFMAARPLLGMLRFSTGDVVPLDRGVVAGRAPAAPDVTDRERPHVLALASPPDGLSRTHLEVRLDGWHVLVVDCGSTNGTIVTPPGQDGFRLREGDPVVIEPGTSVNLADVVTFTYEVSS